MSSHARAWSVLTLSFLALTGCSTKSTLPLAPQSAPARNVILFVGDGMGISTVTAARIFDGQSRGESGEENRLSFEQFEQLALVKTYNTNQQVPDSAGTATAMHTGVKTRAGVINIAPQVRREDCAQALEHTLPTLGLQARARGMAVGVVTTTRVTHATPATIYAHSPERDWESDEYLPSAAAEAGCRDIARQLLELSRDTAPNIVLGGGLREFRGGDLGGKRRRANEDLVAQWLQADSQRQFVTSRDELKQLDRSKQVLGLFSKSHMTYVAERERDTAEPDLESMTVAAIDYLQAQLEDGYYLLVEGGRIDHGHHDGKPGYALTETQAFARAVSAALERVDLSDTLVMVTADHSHVFTLAGYPTRGNPILGHVVGNDTHGEPKSTPTLAADGKPYTSVGYANGPGAIAGGERPVPETGVHAIAQAAIPMARPDIDGSVSDSETHGGEDVALYATGAGAERVRGVIEQNVIYDIMRAALGWD